MVYTVEDLDDKGKFSLLIKIPYNELLAFVLNHLGKRTAITIIFWTCCILFLFIAVFFRFWIAGSYNPVIIFMHTLIGLIVLPLFSVPVHELLHIVPYYLYGARDIRAGMDLKQYLFYVTAHKFVAAQRQFKTVAVFPFMFISVILLILIILVMPGLWKWSFSLFLFVHATMCAGDFALLNFYYLNRSKNIYTWDDANRKEAYFYEKIS